MEELDGDIEGESGWTDQRENRLKGLGVSRRQMLELKECIGAMEPPATKNPTPIEDIKKELSELNSGLRQALNSLERVTKLEAKLDALEPNCSSILSEDDDAPLSISDENAIREYNTSSLRHKAEHIIAQWLRGLPTASWDGLEAWGPANPQLELHNLVSTIGAAKAFTDDLLSRLDSKTQWRPASPYQWVKDIDRALKRGFINEIRENKNNLPISSMDEFEAFHQNRRAYKFKVSKSERSKFYRVCQICRIVAYGGREQDCSRAIAKYQNDIKSGRLGLFPIPH